MPANIIVFFFLLVLCFLLYSLFQEIKKQKKAKSKYRLDERLSRQLLSMVSGDKKTALRLLFHARKKNPHQSYDWYQEKVIRDLERDRR